MLIYISCRQGQHTDIDNYIEQKKNEAINAKLVCKTKYIAKIVEGRKREIKLRRA